MTFHDVRLNVNYERGARGGPQFKTTVTTLASGHEQRNGDWQRARGQWNIGYGVQTKADYAEILDFFLARQGRLYGFRFKDWVDFEATEEIIGTGNASDTEFQLKKTYGAGAYTYVRPITKPVNGTLTVYLDDVLVDSADYSVDYSTGVITFDTAPGNAVVVTATFEFDVPVRFTEDDLEIALQYVEAGAVPSIEIIELRIQEAVLNA